MFFADRMTLDAPRRSAEGYLGAHAKSARSGVYQYLGREVDPAGDHFTADQVVNVYRSPEEVFNAQALGSFVAKPITDDHPSTAVTASNWRDLARGTVMGAVKDGDYVGFDLAFLDADIVDSLDSGKRELSCGYSSEIIVGDGKAPDGTEYQARQVGIKGNHVALVAKGRAGSTCRVGDAAICEAMPSDEVRKLLNDERTYSDGNDPHKTEPARRETSISGGSHVATKTITFDGLPLEVTDAAEAAITKLLNQVKDANSRADKAESQVATLTTDKGKLEGEKAGLEKQLKDATDPATLQAAATARAALINKAVSVSPNIVTDGKSDADIRKEVVNAKLGDDAKDFDDAKIEGAFLSLTRDAPGADPVRDAIRTGVRTNMNDSGASVRNLARAAQF